MSSAKSRGAGTVAQSRQSIEELSLDLSKEEGIQTKNLVEELKKYLGYDEDRIIRRLIEMKEANKITISESK